MAETRGNLGKLADRIGEAISDLLGALSPQPEAVPIPVRNDPRRPR